MKKKFQNFEELESFLKKHNYTYPKIWKAKLKKIKRKERNSSTWKDYRITMYAGNRTLHCARVILEDLYSTGAKLHNKLETISDEKIHKLFSKYSLSADVTKKIYQEIMRFKIETICVDGYKFVLARSNTEKAGGRALTQFFEEKDGKSLPAKC